MIDRIRSDKEQPIWIRVGIATVLGLLAGGLVFAAFRLFGHLEDVNYSDPFFLSRLLIGGTIMGLVYLVYLAVATLFGPCLYVFFLLDQYLIKRRNIGLLVLSSIFIGMASLWIALNVQGIDIFSGRQLVFTDRLGLVVGSLVCSLTGLLYLKFAREHE